MTEPHINEVIAEAKKFRLKLELAKGAKIPLVTEDFPVMNCKLSSLLFTYHALKKWPSIVIHGIGGVATSHDGSNQITHYWLEHQETAIDITADQYNLIENKYLNEKIISSRPFSPVITERIDSMQNYKLFNIAYRDTHVFGLPEIAEDFLHNLEVSHEALEGLAPCT